MRPDPVREPYYALPLAEVHDGGFLKYAEAAAESVLRHLARRNIAAGTIVDLGCGSGRLAEVLVESGHAVTGIDISADMIELAKRRAPAADFRLESVHSADIPNCDCVTAIGEVFNYLFDGDCSRESLKRIFQRVHEALSPGGCLIFDLATPGRLSGLATRQQIHETGDWSIFVDSAENDDRLRRRCIVFTREHGTGRYTRHEETHWLRLGDATEIADQLESIGFHVEQGNSIGKQRLPEGMSSFIATQGEAR